MSIQSFKDEFIPIPMNAILNLERVQAGFVVAAYASLRLFTGLLPENLKKHGLRWTGKHLINEDNPLESFAALEGRNDPLCEFSDRQCRECPLRETLSRSCADDGGLYDMLIEFQDPMPTIIALTQTLEDLKSGL